MSRKRHNGKLNILQRILLEVIWFIIVLISLLPHFVQYRMIAPFLKFIIYNLLHYRVKVVRENLTNSFPERSEAELREVERNFYTVLSEIMVSCIAQATVKKMPREMIFNSDNDLFREKVKDSCWIALTSHFGLWEYYTFYAKYCDQTAVAVYHALEEPISDTIFKRLRGKDFVETVTYKDIVRYIIRHRDGVNGKYFALGLLADQSPPKRPTSEWTTFMGQDTIFFDGGEKIARKLSIPVAFAYQERLSAGRYLLKCDMLHDGHEQVEEGEITNRYIIRLEEEIRLNPHMWLWTHRRWKHKKDL